PGHDQARARRAGRRDRVPGRACFSADAAGVPGTGPARGPCRRPGGRDRLRRPRRGARRARDHRCRRSAATPAARHSRSRAGRGLVEIVDYHMHLRDPDGQLDFTVEGIERFVETAVARGVDEIGFSEHVYYFEQTRALWDKPWMLERCGHDIEPYVEAVLTAKRRG